MPNSLDQPLAVEVSTPCAIVGIGASAGGLLAFKKFFGSMSAESGLAFILLPHLDPHHESKMVDLLKRQTSMTVHEATENMKVAPNCVYTLPPNHYLAIEQGTLHLSDLPSVSGGPTAIDFFFRSLAIDLGERSIGIILSGTSNHGTEGAKEIKRAGGMVMVQAPDTAEFDQMPQNVIATGIADYVLKPEEMPSALLDYIQKSIPPVSDALPLEGELAGHVDHILELLRMKSGREFRHIRKSMLLRRIKRRMGIHSVKEVSKYIEYLYEHPEEPLALSQDLLIGVTSFFRDAAAFSQLRQLVIEKLVSNELQRVHGPTERDSVRAPFGVRVWVPGCATGQEAYSIAMLMHEEVSASKGKMDFRIFATDADERALDIARLGTYNPHTVVGLSSEQREIFFEHSDPEHWRVKRSLRDSVTFAFHDLIQDAPFSQIDLVSCRNVLIYFEPDVQIKILQLFHYSLREGGYLFLGPSESISRDMGDYFETVSKQWRIYRRLSSLTRVNLDIPVVALKERRSPLRRTRGIIFDNHAQKDQVNDRFSGQSVSSEELLSVNEELQFANEELESSKEELQSLNEELATANTQLRDKVAELDWANSDLTNLITSSDIATIFLDRELCIKRFTPSVTDLYGLRATDLNRPIGDFAPKFVDTEIVNDCRQVLQTQAALVKSVWSTSEPIPSSTTGVAISAKTNRCYLLRIRPYRTKTDQVEGIILTFIDITERMSAEAQSARMAAILRDSNDAVMVQDSTGQIIAWNRGAELMYGYTRAEALLLNARDLVPREKGQEPEILLVDDVGHPSKKFIETRRLTKNGRILDVEVTLTVYRNERGEDIGLATTERDISERKVAARSLLESTEHIRSILKTASDAIITINQQGLITAANPATERMFGYTLSELLNENVKILMPSHYRDEHDGYIHRYLETNEARIIGIGREVTAMRKDGSIFPVDLAVSQVDHLGYFTGIIRDISRQKELQRQVLEIAGESERRIGQELHDGTGQELTGLSLFAGTLAEILDSAPQLLEGKSAIEGPSGDWRVAQDTMQRMRTICGRLAEGLVTANRHVQQLSHGIMPVQVEPAGLNAALEELAYSINALPHIACRFMCPETVEVANNHTATQLYRIAQEASNNALRHGKAKQIEIALLNVQKQISLVITDDGMGFQSPEEARANSQAGQANKAGMGLEIMRFRAGIIGGSIQIQRHEPRGVIVRCMIPRGAENNLKNINV